MGVVVVGSIYLWLWVKRKRESERVVFFINILLDSLYYFIGLYAKKKKKKKKKTGMYGEL